MSRRCISGVKHALLSIWLLLAGFSLAWGGTAEGVFADHMAFLASEYAKQNRGLAPSSWSELEAPLGRSLDQQFSYIKPTKRYAFLSQPLRLPPPHAGDLLVITRRPFRAARSYQTIFGSHDGLRERGRYIMYRNKKGDFKASYVPETYVQEAFRGFESLLPAPDNEPLRAHELRARKRSIITWSVIALIAIAFLARRALRRALRSLVASDKASDTWDY
jgi:hypothetical protein